MREDKRERENARDRSKFLIIKIDKDEEMVREARERDQNTREKAVVCFI